MILELCKGVHCVDLGESFQTHIYLQNVASIQPRTSPVKFARRSRRPARVAAGRGRGRSRRAPSPGREIRASREYEDARVGKCRKTKNRSAARRSKWKSDILRRSNTFFRGPPQPNPSTLDKSATLLHADLAVRGEPAARRAADVLQHPAHGPRFD